MDELQSFIATPSVSVGYTHHAIILPNGVVYTGGLNDHGELGDGTARDSSLTQLTADTAMKAVSTDWNTTMVIDIYGTAYFCGQTVITPNNRIQSIRLPSPAIKTASSRLFTLILLSDGQVYKSGINVILNSHREEDAVPPTLQELLELPFPAIDIAAGFNQMVILLTDGSIYGYGANYLDLTDMLSVMTPLELPWPSDVHAIGVECGMRHTIVLLDDGSVYGRGSNGDGQLGIGDTSKHLDFVRMDLDKTVVNISCGKSSTFCLTENGEVYACGYNEGVLGVGDKMKRLLPTRMLLSKPVEFLASGGDRTLIQVQDAGIYICGDKGNILIPEPLPLPEYLTRMLE